MNRIDSRRAVPAALLAVYLGLVGWITMSRPRRPTNVGWLRRFLAWCADRPALSWITFDRVEFTANIAMFIPIAIIVTLLVGHRRWWIAIVVGALLSCGIEFAQQFIPGRFSDPRDLVSNTIGAVLGTLIAVAVPLLHARQSRLRALESG